MLDVEISHTTIGTLEDYPYIKPSSWLKYMDAEQRLQVLFGTRELRDLGPALTLFWERYKETCPGHMVFGRAEAGLIRLDRALPIYLHADEGRTLKKRPLFLVSMQPAFGRGVGSQGGLGSMQAALKQHDLLANVKGNSLVTRFLCGMMMRADYSEHPENLDELLTLICMDLKLLGEQGIQVQDHETLFLVPLGNKGDWDYLAKAGHFTRSYRNAPKFPTSKNPSKPMCHLCLAGSPNLPYEDVLLAFRTI